MEENEHEPMSEELVAAVDAALRKRYETDAVVSESDFVSGAMSAALALGYWPPPPRWVIMPMGGRSVLNERDDTAESERERTVVEIPVQPCEWCNDLLLVDHHLTVGEQTFPLRDEYGDTPEALHHTDDGEFVCQACLEAEAVA